MDFFEIHFSKFIFQKSSAHQYGESHFISVEQLAICIIMIRKDAHLDWHRQIATQTIQEKYQKFMNSTQHNQSKPTVNLRFYISKVPHCPTCNFPFSCKKSLELSSGTYSVIPIIYTMCVSEISNRVQGFISYSEFSYMKTL